MKREIADLKRFREILGVLFDEGFCYFIDATHLRKFLPLKKRIQKEKECAVTNEVRLRRTLERLGPTFIKLGQLLSIRPDFVPKEYIHELEKLQDSVPSFSFSEVKKIIEESTGKKLDEIFKKFDEKPIASASIAQVHKAVLKSGEIVAVKVRRPNIKELMNRDIEIMMFIAKLAEKHFSAIRKYRPTAIVDEFSEWTRKELDFNIEMENMRRFYENFKDSKTTKIPKVYGEHCNEKLLIMEFIDGVELHKAKGNKLKGIDLKQALHNGFYSILEQVFKYGLFHADPHPSNVLVLKGNKVGFVDFGIIGKFDDKLKEEVINLFVAIMKGDAEEIVEVLLDLGQAKEDIDLNRFKKRINDAIYLLKGSEVKNVKISRVLEDILDIALEFEVKMPREFILFAKTIVTIEGISLMYYPEFRFGDMVKPFVEDILVEKYRPSNVLKRGMENFLGLKKLAEKLPGQAARVLDKLEKGKIKIEMKDTDIERLSVELDKSSNRLTYGMIIAALLVSGSLTINIGERVFYGLTLISLFCFSIAAILGIILLESILKENR